MRKVYEEVIRCSPEGEELTYDQVKQKQTNLPYESYPSPPLAQIDEVSCCSCQRVSPHRPSGWIWLARSHRVLPIEQIPGRARTTPVDALPFSPQTRLRWLKWVRSRPLVWGECRLQYQICQWPTQCLLDLFWRWQTLRRIKGTSLLPPPPPFFSPSWHLIPQFAHQEAETFLAMLFKQGLHWRLVPDQDLQKVPTLLSILPSLLIANAYLLSFWWSPWNTRVA